MSEYIFWQDDSGIYKREEIVRCKDCEHYDEGRCYADKWSTASLMPAHRVASDGFCAWGERREQ